MSERHEIENEMVENLQKLPTLIKEKSTELYNKRQQYEEKKYALKNLELGVKAKVADAVRPDGKPRYSNAQKREAVTELRLRSMREYQELSTRVNNLKIDIDYLALQLEFCKNKFSAAKALARLLGNS